MPDKSDPKEKTQATNMFVGRDRRGPVRLWRGLSKGHKVVVLAVLILVLAVLGGVGFVLLSKEPAPEPPQTQVPEPEPEWSQIFQYKPEEQP